MRAVQGVQEARVSQVLVDGEQETPQVPGTAQAARPCASAGRALRVGTRLELPVAIARAHEAGREVGGTHCGVSNFRAYKFPAAAIFEGPHNSMVLAGDAAAGDYRAASGVRRVVGNGCWGGCGRDVQASAGACARF